MSFIKSISNYFSAPHIPDRKQEKSPLLHDYIQNFSLYAKKREGAKFLDFIILNVSKEVLDSLDIWEKKVVCLINKNIVFQSECDKQPNWVHFSRLFFRGKQPDFLEPFTQFSQYINKPSAAKIDEDFHLGEWELAKTEQGIIAMERIRSFILGESNSLDLRQLGLTSLPKILFTDERFQECLFEDNPLKHFPKKLTIGEIRNDLLFDKMNDIIAKERAKLSREVFSAKGILACIYEFTKGDIAVNKQLAQAKQMQCRHRLRQYQEKLKKNRALAKFTPHSLKKELKTLLTFFSTNEMSFPTSLSQSELLPVYERAITCVKNLEQTEISCKKNQLLDNSLIRMGSGYFFPFPLEPFASCASELSTLSKQTKAAQKIREFLQGRFAAWCMITIEYKRTKNKETFVIPPEVGIFKTLISLNASKSSITEIPREIMGCWMLRTLDLSHNQIRKIPAELRHCKLLRDLNLSHNKITEIPIALTSCWILRNLDLSHNEIREIPVKINRFRRWQKLTLNLSHNKITKIPLEISYCKGIDAFYIHNNPISQSEIAAVKKLVHGKNGVSFF
jgi:Leucine-rich repeat (LRR) protein